MLTNRQITLLTFLHQNPHGVANQDLASYLKISMRTLRLEISKLNQEHGKPLVVIKRGKGYFINDDFEEEVQKLVKDSELKPVEKEIRSIKIVSQLLFQSPLSLYDLSDNLYLSESSLRLEIQQINALYSEPMFMVKNEEVHWYGDRNQKRNNIVRFVKNVVIEESPTLNNIKALFQDEFDAVKWDTLNENIISLTKLNELTLRCQERRTLAAAIWITILLNDIDGPLPKEYEQEEVVVPYLLRLIHVEYPQLYTSDILNLAKLVNTFRTSSNDPIEISEFADLIYDEFCNEVFDKYSLDLRESEQLTENLKIHIEYMMRRIESGFELKNPLIADIKTKYPYAYEISTLIVHILYKYRRFYLPDDELSFITIYVEHFLVNEHKKLKAVLLCSQRSSVQSIIHHWLERHFFNQIEVIAVLEESEFDIDRFDAIDLVIGHPTLPKNLDIDTFRFSGLPADKDIPAFYTILHTIKNRTRIRKLIQNLFHSQHIEIYNSSVEFDEIIRSLSKRMKDSKIISSVDLFVEDILNREIHYPSVLVPNVMIPHPLFTFSKRNAVGVALIRKPNTPSKLIFLLALTKKRTDEVNALFEYFKFLANDQHYIQSLGSALNPDDLLNKIFELPEIN